ncbi:MAG: hypothetical protein CME17_06475 [Gemmatimonadetes bacterium]|nr:hypothetical protein [Gemmatimonadota bacterium]
MATGNDDPTQGDPTELEVEVPADPTFCNHLTRNNTLCRVPVTEDDPCGYHDSDVQRSQEIALKETIITILNESLDTDCSLSDFPLDERCPAYDLLKYIMDCVPPRLFRSLEDQCEHNWIARIDGFYTCSYCQDISEVLPCKTGLLHNYLHRLDINRDQCEHCGDIK